MVGAPYATFFPFMALPLMPRATLPPIAAPFFEAAFPQHLPKKTSIGAKMRRDAVTSSTLIIVLAPAFRF